MDYVSQNSDETKKIAESFARSLVPGRPLLLIGELGAGKTTFMKGLANSLGIKKDILSPTFTLMNVYEINPEINNIKQLVHVDTYRLKDAEELLAIGFSDYLKDQETLCVIEWPEKIMEILRGVECQKIELTHLPSQGRSIRIFPPKSM